LLGVKKQPVIPVDGLLFTQSGKQQLATATEPSEIMMGNRTDRNNQTCMQQVLSDTDRRSPAGLAQFNKANRLDAPVVDKGILCIDWPVGRSRFGIALGGMGAVGNVKNDLCFLCSTFK